jgi:hypothetical protein
VSFCLKKGSFYDAVTAVVKTEGLACQTAPLWWLQRDIYVILPSGTALPAPGALDTFQIDQVNTLADCVPCSLD